MSISFAKYFDMDSEDLIYGLENDPNFYEEAKAFTKNFLNIYPKYLQLFILDHRDHMICNAFANYLNVKWQFPILRSRVAAKEILGKWLAEGTLH